MPAMYECLCTQKGCRCKSPVTGGGGHTACKGCRAGRHTWDFKQLSAASTGTPGSDSPGSPAAAIGQTVYTSCCCPKDACDAALKTVIERETGLCKFCGMGAHDKVNRARMGDVLSHEQYEAARMRHSGKAGSNPGDSKQYLFDASWSDKTNAAKGGAVKADFQQGFNGSRYNDNRGPSDRHAATPVFTIGSVTYCGGSRVHCEGKPFDDNWLVVSLLGHPPAKEERDKVDASNPKTAAALNKHTDNAPPKVRNWICIDWRDGSAPPVKAEFWRKLHRLTRQSPGVTNVLFFCDGGHGRTGTALASVLVAVTGKPADEAVEFVRASYCKRAVETNTQVAYLKGLLLPEPEEQEPSGTAPDTTETAITTTTATTASEPSKGD